MSEGLTKEAIDQICDLMELHRWIEAIKALRMAWPFGIKEAKDFLDPYSADVTALRNKLLQMADIKEGAIFENGYLRVEVKKTGASFLEAHRFLMEVLSKLDLRPDSQEVQDAIMEIADLFPGTSLEGINELCVRLTELVYQQQRVSQQELYIKE